MTGDESVDDVRRAMNGDVLAIQRVFERWYGRVYAHCQAKLISRADAEDATQETFVRSFSKIRELKSPDAFGAWVRRIAHHVCVDLIRKNKVRHTVAMVDDVPSSNNQSTSIENAEQQDALIQRIHELPESLREVVFLHYYQEMTYDQMAQWLGVARSTVSERLSNARGRLRRDLTSDVEVTS